MAFTGKSFISALIRGGFSARGGLSWLQDRGLGYSWPRFLTDWRETQIGIRSEDYFRRLPSINFPKQDVIHRSVFDLDAKYRYHYEVSYFDPLTGKLEHTRRSLLTDDLLSAGEGKDLVSKQILDTDPTVIEELEEVSFVDAEIAKWAER